MCFLTFFGATQWNRVQSNVLYATYENCVFVTLTQATTTTMSTAVHLPLCVEKYSVKLAHGHLQTNHDGRLSRHLKKERPNDFDFRVTFTETGCSTCFIWIRLRRKKSWISGVFTRCPFWWPREKLELSPQEYASCKPTNTSMKMTERVRQ